MTTGLLDAQTDRLVDMIQPVNLLHPLARGMLSWWKALPGTTGGSRFMDIRNPGPNGKHGTLTNMDPEKVWKASERGVALDFDATEGQYVDLGSITLLTTGQPFSVCWWENINANTDVRPTRWLLAVSGTSDHFLVFRATDANYSNISFGKAPDSFGVVKSQSVTDIANSIGIWKHFVITGSNPVSSTPADYKIYEDGVSNALVDANNFPGPTGNRIGYGGNNNGPNCLMDDCIVYNSILLPNGVRQLYTLGQQNYPGLLNRIESPVVLAPAAGGVTLSERSYPRGVKRGVLRGVA